MCDGLFLIEDTAKHNGFEPDPEEISQHLEECEECWGAYEAFQADSYDVDAPIAFWPEEVNGHA